MKKENFKKKLIPGLFLLSLKLRVMSLNNYLLLIITILIANVFHCYCYSDFHRTDSYTYSSLNNTNHFISVTIPTPNLSLLTSSLKEYSSNNKQRRNLRENICNSYCECNSNFENVALIANCSLNQNQTYIFGSNKYVPIITTSLLIRLARGATLHIEQNFFFDNKLNRISIEGTENGFEEVQIKSNAFNSNNAWDPDIEIYNCHKVILGSKAFNGKFNLSISNSQEVIIHSEAFHNTSFHGYLNNIRDLKIHEHALKTAKAKLKIVKCNIGHLYPFGASIKEINFFNCTIGTINTETFDVHNINSIVFELCSINVFKSRAITEKVFCDHLIIHRAIIGVIESEAIAGSGITEVIFSKNIIDTIQKNAIYMTAVNVSIVNNRIKRVGHKWLTINDWSNITISQNQFGDFDYMLLDNKINKKTPPYCIFEKNFITYAKSGSLNLTSPYCIIREISFYHHCTCNISWLTKLSSRDLKSESYCKIDDALKYCFNATIFNVRKYEYEICDHSKPKLDCMNNINYTTFDVEFLEPETIATKLEYTKLIYIVVGISIIAILVIIILAVIYRYFKLKPINTPNIPIIVNDNTNLENCKKFSNEDHRIIDQTLNMMKRKYPPDIYEKVLANTNILFHQENVTEMQRVKTIGDIVQILGECENSGEDFVAFTDILYKNLAPTTGDIEPIYAEPHLPNLIAFKNNDKASMTKKNINHIYAEPSSIQQPLLTNEYSLPADKNDETNLYTEPILIERDNGPKIISPHSVTQQLTPSTSNDENED